VRRWTQHARCKASQVIINRVVRRAVHLHDSVPLRLENFSNATARCTVAMIVRFCRCSAEAVKIRQPESGSEASPVPSEWFEPRESKAKGIVFLRAWRLVRH